MKALRMMAMVMMTAMVSVCMVACGGNKTAEAPAEAVETVAACDSCKAACDSCTAACNK